MVKYKWVKEEFPKDSVVKQVYGIVFSNDGKILLRVEEDKYKLTGGKPEAKEKFEETLKREFVEELNIEIEDIYYLGYLEVKELNQQPYAQVRMIAKIEKIKENRPDIDNGKLYKRFLSNLENVKKYLNYQDAAGNELIEDAIKLARKKYSWEENEKEYFI